MADQLGSLEPEEIYDDKCSGENSQSKKYLRLNADNPEIPVGIDNKTKTKSCSLHSKTRKSPTYEDRTFLENNFSILAKHHRKKKTT